MKKAVFLDRDGTVMIDRIYLNDPGGISVFKESYPALKLLHDNHFAIVLVTNQSGVARGIVQEENVKKINTLLMDDFQSKGAPIAGAYYCPHPVNGGCLCRKPNPGMLEAAAKEHGLNLKDSWMVGDRMSDVEAGRRAGAKTILLQNETTPPMDPTFLAPDFVCRDILEAAQLILEKSEIQR